MNSSPASAPWPQGVLGEGGERLLTEMNNSELLRFVALDINATVAD